MQVRWLVQEAEPDDGAPIHGCFQHAAMVDVPRVGKHGVGQRFRLGTGRAMVRLAKPDAA